MTAMPKPLHEVARLTRQKDWGGLADWLQQQGQELLAKGFRQQLLDLLRTIPGIERQPEPWLEYWLGRCRMGNDLPRASEHFTRAFQSFDLDGDPEGRVSSLASLLDSLWLMQEDCHDFDPWITQLEPLKQFLIDRRREDLLDDLSRSAFAALSVRQPDHPDLPFWEARSLKRLASNEPIEESMLRGLQLMLHYTWNTGQRAAAELVLETLDTRIGKQQHSGFVHCLFHVVHAAYLMWFDPDIHACARVVERGLQLSRELQLPDWDLPLMNSMLYACCAEEDLAAADRWSDRLKQCIRLHPRPMDRAIHYHFLAYRAWLRQRPKDALPAIRQAVEITDSRAYRYPWLLCSLAEAVLTADTGQPRQALLRLGRLRRIAGRFNSDNSRYTALMNAAVILLKQGHRQACLAYLGQAMELGARHRYSRTPWLRTDDLSRLCALAFEQRLQPDHAAYLVHSLGLRAPSEAITGRVPWPWPCRIRVLGGIRIEPGSTDEEDSRSPTSLYRLLLTLVAAGPDGLDIEQLGDRLWPDSEGDKAYRRLKTTVHRLRKRLGSANTVRHANRRISLDPSVVWVDAWAFERSTPAKDTPIEELDRSIALFRGPIVNLNEEDALLWNYACRLADRHGALVRQRAEACASSEQALQIWRQAIAVNPQPGFFQGAIDCLEHQNRNDEALRLRQALTQWQFKTSP
jgi:tetratricopeptide (TPR) repeat protein